MRRGLDKGEKEKVAEKLMDVGNLALGALVLGQVLSREKSVPALFLGIVAWLVMYGIALVIMIRS